MLRALGQTASRLRSILSHDPIAMTGDIMDHTGKDLLMARAP
jgi:hypothetical protein